MSVVELELTDLEAIHFYENPTFFEEYLAEKGLAYSRELWCKLVDRYLQASDEALHEYFHPPSRRKEWKGWRPDLEALRAYLEVMPSMTIRRRQVARLCLVEGLSLTAAAEYLGISRETVRTHLKRIREQARQAGALSSLEPLEWEAQPEGSQRGQSPQPRR